MFLTKEEIILIMDLIAEKYGASYLKPTNVSKLQAKLSIMFKQRMEEEND